MKILVNKYVRVLRNLMIDFRYGGKFLGGTEKTRYSIFGAYNTSNSDYALLAYLFKDKIKESDVLVDVECGKGRVINWWLSQGLKNKIIGLELDPEIAAKTRSRLRYYKNVTIIAGDALKNIPREATILYLYNPFNRIVMEKLKVRLVDLFGDSGDISIYYYNSVHADVFENDPVWVIENVDIASFGSNKAVTIKFKTIKTSKS